MCNRPPEIAALDGDVGVMLSIRPCEAVYLAESSEPEKSSKKAVPEGGGVVETVMLALALAEPPVPVHVML